MSVLYFEASIQLPLHLRHFFLNMPIQHLSLHFKVHLTLKNAQLPLVFFLDFNSPWYDLRWRMAQSFSEKKKKKKQQTNKTKQNLPLVGIVLKAD